MYSETPDVFDDLTGQSATADIMNRMELFGAMPPTDEEDPRPLPELDDGYCALEAVFETLSALFADTCLEGETTDVLWNTVNVFQRKLERLDKGFDQLGFEIRRAIREQDGTEVKSVELEKLELRARSTSDARDTFEALRDHAAGLFAAATGHPWMPGRGSKVSRSGLTAAVVDSREFLAATERRKTQSLAPEGPKVVVSGGMDFTDHTLIWNALDKARAKHADMVLVHGGAPKGVDLIAAKWAEPGASRRWCSSPTGSATASPAPGSCATTRCSTSCPSASWPFPAPASPRTWSTRPATSASRPRSTAD